MSKKKKRLAAKRAAKRERLLKSCRLDYDKLAETLKSMPDRYESVIDKSEFDKPLIEPSIRRATDEEVQKMFDELMNMKFHDCSDGLPWWSYAIAFFVGAIITEIAILLLR